MGFLSSLFNFGDKPTTSSSNVIPKYPEELKPYIEEAMKDTQEIYKQRLGEGYQPYGGQTIAGFTPEEIASQQGLKSLVGTQAPLQQEALDLSRIASREFTPEVAQQYMSPYLRTALDAQKVEAQRQYERTKVPQFEADAVAAGGMSGLGTRAAVESAERATGQNRLLANIEAAGQQQAFEDAQNIFKDQTARERQSAAQISTAAPNIFKSALSEQGLLQTMGEQKRDLAQSSLDEAYLKYVEEQQFPEQQLGRYQSSIYGNPLLKQPSYNTTGTKTGGGPGLGKTLLGLGTTALGFGTGGGSTIGGSLFGKLGLAGGGGISSTMKAQPYVQYMNRRAVGGSVLNPSDGKVTTFEEYNRAEREAEAVAQAVAGLQQESSPVLSTPASAVATAPAPAMASAAPTGLPAAMPPAAMPPAAMPQLPNVKESRPFDGAAMPQLPGGGLKKAELPDDMPSGFTRPGAAALRVLVPFWNPTTGEEWTAPSSGYIPPPGWEKKGGLGQRMPLHPDQHSPSPEPEYTYDKSRGGFKDVNGELTIDPETSMYGWLDDDDGPYFDQQAFLADAYNTNISGGVQGRLGRGNFIDKTEDEDDEGNYFNTYGLRISPRHTTFGPRVNPWWEDPDLEKFPTAAPWEKKGGLGQPLPWETEGTENQPMPEPEYTYDKSRGGFKDVNGELAIDPNTALYGWHEDDDGPYFDQQAFLRDAYNANISGGLRGGLGRHNFIEETQNENEGELYYNYNLARSIPPVSAGLQSLNRRGGGQVMPPVVYRQTNGSIRSGGGYDYSNMLKKQKRKPIIGESEIEKGRRLKKTANRLRNIPVFNIKQRPNAGITMQRGSVSSPLPTVQAQPNRQTTATDRAGLASLGGLTDAQLREEYASEAQQLRRDDPDSVLSKSKNERALIAGLDPQAGRDFAEYGTDESGDPIVNLENKLVDQQSLAAGTESRSGVLGLQDLIKPKDAQEATVAATKKVAENNVSSAMQIRGIEKETANDVKGLLSSFSDKYKKLAKDDPYKMQKFWFTVGSNIMKKGNAFANMAEGLRIAVNDLDGTRKEKNKLLMDLEDTLTRANVKLTEKEGTSKVNLEKLTNKQKNLLAKLGPIGMEAFNKQVKANQSFMAALTAARKAQTAAETEARKNRDKNKLEAKDINPARKTIDTVLTRVASGIFRAGVAISNKARNYKEDLTAQYLEKLSELGPVGATNWLSNRVRKDSPNYFKLVDKK